MVLPEPRHPGIGGEFVKIHARKGVGIVEIGAVALVEFEQQVGNLAEDAAALHRDVRIAYGRQFGAVADAGVETVVFGTAGEGVAYPGRESEREDRVGRSQVLLVERHAVDRLVLRKAQSDARRDIRYGVDRRAVGPQHRDITVGEDALHARPRERTHAVAPLVLVDRFAAVDHREPLVAAREDRREYVAFGQGVLSGAQLHHVVPGREGQLARQPPVEGQFDASAALHVFVARAVGHVASDAHRAADVGGRAPSQLHAEAFEFVEAGEFVVGTYADVFRVPVADDDGVDESVDVAVEGHVPHRIDHRIDALLLFAQRVGAYALPVGFVVLPGPVVADHDVVVHAQDFVGNRFADPHVAVRHLARADERCELRRVGRRDRELRRHAVAAAEPAAAVGPPVLVFEHQVPDPVDVDPFGHACRCRLQGVGRRVDIDLAVEHRDRETLGMEADFVGLAALVHHAVHEEIVVERAAPVGQRTGETHVEDVDEVVVEIHVAVHPARELRHGETVLDARNAAGEDHLALELRTAAAMELGRRFGDHRRKVSLPRERRGVHIVEHEPEVALQALAPELRPDVGQVEFHLGIGAAAVRVVAVGVVLRLVADHAVEDRMRGVLAGGDDHLPDAELHGFEGEIHVVERPGRHREGLRGVADHRGLHAAHRVAGFEGVDALLVGGDARRGAGEYDADELQGFSVGGVGHPSADTCGLCRSSCRPEDSEQKHDDRPLRHTAANVAKMYTFGQFELPLRQISR